MSKFEKEILKAVKEYKRFLKIDNLEAMMIRSFAIGDIKKGWI